ncbi:MAG: HRDC domain-containing protein [bacterium]
MANDYTMIDTPGDLGKLIEYLSDTPCVAVDTEFVWERTFYARLGMIQLGTPDGTCFLIDTVAISDLTPLGKVFTNPGIVKILHDAPQDLMILRRATGGIPQNIFDTRLAAGFAGLSSEISLQNLLANLLDVQLPKGHTRADWMARPLSGEQLEYAADDVRYLPRAATLMREKARETGVESWLNEELQLLNDPILTEERSPAETYRRIRGSGRLGIRSLAVLRELATWREQEAKSADLPRQHVAEDSELLSLACIMPTQIADFEKCRDFKRRTEARYGEPLLAAVQQGLAIPESECPLVSEPPDERKIGKERIAVLVENIRISAEAKRVDARLVSTKNDVLMLLHEGTLALPMNHRLLRGWRAELLGDSLTTLRGI